MICSQLAEFCARAPKAWKRFCFPGGGLHDITEAADEVTRQTPANTTYVIHVGTNDVQRNRREELMRKYRKMIKTYKEKSSWIIVSGIIPRLHVEDKFYDDSISKNRQLAELCTREEDRK